MRPHKRHLNKYMVALFLKGVRSVPDKLARVDASLPKTTLLGAWNGCRGAWESLLLIVVLEVVCVLVLYVCVAGALTEQLLRRDIAHRRLGLPGGRMGHMCDVKE